MTWKTRLTLEALGHQHTAFVTLTYRNDTLPMTPDGLPTLTPRDLSLWLKRFRKATNQPGMRFYAAGEYSPADRPHYHLILYGYQGCRYGKSRYRDGRTIDCCSQCDLVRDTWGKGIIETQPGVPAHFSYTAGYVQKKMTSKHDSRLEGRYPEFSRQSNGGRTGLGGLGFSQVKQIAAISKQRLATGVSIDVADQVRVNGQKMLLGRYIRNKVRKELNLEEKAPPEVQAQIIAELLPLLEASKNHPTDITLKRQLVSRAQGAINSIKSRHEMYNSRKRNRSL